MNAGFRALAAALALLLASAQAGRAEDGRGEGVVTVDADPVDLEDAALIEVSASIKGSSVYVNRAFVGRTDYASGALKPGDYYIEVSKPGYYALGYSLALAARISYSLHFSLAPVAGSLAVSVEPPDAELLVDGRPMAGPVASLPIGAHDVTARRFGYEGRRLSVDIRDRETSSLSFALPRAAFSVSAPASTKASFNPANAGILGRTEIRFEATSYGRARLEIRDQTGNLVGQAEFPRLETWSQAYFWDGRGADGGILPDGEYRAILVATPEAGVPTLPEGIGVGTDGTLTREGRIRIDSSIVVRTMNSLAAMPGLLHFPDPAPQPPGTFAAELAWLSPAADPAGSAFALGSALSLGEASVLGVSAAAETGRAEVSGGAGGDLGLSLAYSYARAGPFAGAVFLRGFWTSSEAPFLPGSRSGIEASLPASLRSGALVLGAAPGLFVDLGSASPTWTALGRAGAWVSGPSFRAGLSAALRFDVSSGGLEPAWPAQAAAEGRALISPSPLVLAGYLLAELEPGSAPSWGFGLGVGLLL